MRTGIGGREGQTMARKSKGEESDVPTEREERWPSIEWLQRSQIVLLAVASRGQVLEKANRKFWLAWGLSVPAIWGRMSRKSGGVAPPAAELRSTTANQSFGGGFPRCLFTPTLHLGAYIARPRVGSPWSSYSIQRMK